MLEYVVLGVAVLFVGAILYGTWRRHETFTTMKGNYPPWSEIQRQVSAIFDKYYTYDLSEFAKIKETDVYGVAKKMVETVSNNYGIPLDPGSLPKETLSNVKKFLPPGFVFDTVNAPVTAVTGILEGGKKYFGSLIKSHDPKKAGSNSIFELVELFYKIEAMSGLFKNAVIVAYMDVARQTIKPVAKTS
jgi:hypothetical protein